MVHRQCNYKKLNSSTIKSKENVLIIEVGEISDFYTEDYILKRGN